MDGQIISLVLALIAVGALAGFSAGLFGVGGGMIIVPALYYTFNILGYPVEIIMHMAVRHRSPLSLSTHFAPRPGIINTGLWTGR